MFCVAWSLRTMLSRVLPKTIYYCPVFAPFKTVFCILSKCLNEDTRTCIRKQIILLLFWDKVVGLKNLFLQLFFISLTTIEKNLLLSSNSNFYKMGKKTLLVKNIYFCFIFNKCLILFLATFNVKITLNFKVNINVL